MSNVCRNKVTLAVASDKRDVLDSVVAQLHGEIPKFPQASLRTSFSLEKIAPTPPDLLKNYAGKISPNQRNHRIATYGAADWKDWRNKYWGTKHDVIAKEPVINEDFGTETIQATYEFDSSLDPPLQALETLSQNFPGLIVHARYDNPTGWESGVSSYYLGQCMHSEGGDSILALETRYSFDYYLRSVHNPEALQEGEVDLKEDGAEESPEEDAESIKNFLQLANALDDQKDDVDEWIDSGPFVPYAEWISQKKNIQS